MRIGWNKTVFRQLLASHLFIVIIGLGAIGFFIPNLVKSYIYDSAQQELLRQAKKVNLSIQEYDAVNDQLLALLLFFDETFDKRIWLFDQSGQIIATSVQDEVSVGKSVSPQVVDAVLKGNTVNSRLQFEGLNQPMLSVVVPWGKDENLYGGIVLHSPVNGIEESIGNIREAVLWVTLVGVLASIIMVSYSSWSLTRPLHKLARIAAELSLGNFRIRMEDDLPEEFEDLVSMLNAVGAKLEQMEEEKRKSEQISEDLLANISHELRTPLTAIRGFLEALQDNLIPEEGRKRYYDLMYQEMLYMNRLVDDLLDLLKLQKDSIVLSLHPLELEPVLQKIAFAFTPSVQEKGLELTVELADSLPKMVADVDRFEQIISNLLKNAIKFTDQGSIKLSAFEESGHIVIEVADTGCGIPETDLQRIWERFFKTDRGRSRENKGAGLGLAIVKELVELHQGSISVKSHLDQGTTFRITFPLHPDHKMFTKGS